MKSNPKTKIIILITLGILFALLPIITTNLSFITGNSNNSSEYSDDITLDSEHLKISAVSEKIHINNNWTAAKAAGICTGNGTYSEPYVIENLVIDGGGLGSGILIENSNVYFKIENCTTTNSGSYPNAGITLSNVTNSQLLNNDCAKGIHLEYSNNNAISGNSGAIRLEYSDKNILSESYYVDLENSDNNTISGTSGMVMLWDCDYNTVSDNTGEVFVIGNNNYITRNNVSGIEYGMTVNGQHNNVARNYVVSTTVGIKISGNDTIVLENTANNNYYGIVLQGGNHNTVSGNTANDNYYGIYLSFSNDNIVSGNTLIENDECIVEENCQGNKFSDNGACTYGQGGGGIPGYNISFLISILSIVAIILSNKINKTRRK